MNLRAMIRGKIVRGRVVADQPIRAVDNQDAVIFLVDNHPYTTASNRHLKRRGTRYRMLTRFQRDSVE